MTTRASERPSVDRGAEPQRLLFVADTAVAGVEDLPPSGLVLIEAAAELYVVTPSLPGRLDWLADDFDPSRRAADARLDTTLGLMRSIGVQARGASGADSLMAALADAVAEFLPDLIIVALRSSENANWQERGLIEHIEERFGLPVTTFEVGLGRHMSAADGPLVLCYDGSAAARQAIERAGHLFPGEHALVVTVWQPTAVLGSFAWSGATASMVNFVELDRAGAEDGGRVAAEGARIAREAGLHAEPIAIEATGAVWKTILETADARDASAIILGSRGLAGLRAMLLGSVSTAVVHHADRPILIVREPHAGP